MSKNLEKEIERILTEHTDGGAILTESELIAELDKIPGFWAKAEIEEANEETNH